MRALITGGAGCIGSDLAAAMLARGHEVTVLDNFSSGREEHLAGLDLRLVRGDVLDKSAVAEAMRGAEVVWHLAANPDVRAASEEVVRDMEATGNVLEAMLREGAREVLFTSSSAIYGIVEHQPIPESQPCDPISMYGMTKAGCEALVQSTALMQGVRGWVFRLANIVGGKVRKRGRTVISDFIAKLRENPRLLEILGDGRQSKSYLSADDCSDAMLFAWQHSREPLTLLNVGGTDSIPVTRIAELVVEGMGLRDVEFAYTGGEGGWPGDVPNFILDATALAKLGWQAKRNSEQSVRWAIGEVLRRGVY